MTKIQKSSTLNFTHALARLEEIVKKLENPELDLEEGLKLLEEGVKLHKQCEQILKSTQTKIDDILKIEEVS